MFFRLTLRAVADNLQIESTSPVFRILFVPVRRLIPFRRHRWHFAQNQVPVCRSVVGVVGSGVTHPCQQVLLPLLSGIAFILIRLPSPHAIVCLLVGLCPLGAIVFCSPFPTVVFSTFILIRLPSPHDIVCLLVGLCPLGAIVFCSPFPTVVFSTLSLSNTCPCCLPPVHLFLSYHGRCQRFRWNMAVKRGVECAFVKP